jgi:hypothetical protein
MATKEYRGVLDRFEDDLAVMLLERDGETVEDIALPREQLPEEGRHQDAIFWVEMEGEMVQTVSYRPEETVERAEQAQSRFDHLSQRSPESDEKK